MALTNLDKNTLNNLFEMIHINDNINEKHNLINSIKKDSITYSQLDLINNQISLLKLQANNIIEQHLETNNINNISCNFKKVPGTFYYLYKNKGKLIISLVEPDSESKSLIYDEFVAKYYYDYDLSFKKII